MCYFFYFFIFLFFLIDINRYIQHTDRERREREMCVRERVCSSSLIRLRESANRIRREPKIIKNYPSDLERKTYIRLI